MALPEFSQFDAPDQEESFLLERYEAFSIPRENLHAIFPRLENIGNESFAHLKYEADRDDLDAQFLVGLHYENGEETRQSYKSAFHYYQLAADKGHSGAQAALAILYEEGLGTKQSDELAFHYFKMAADQGNPAALTKLGSFYEEGKGVRKSLKEAMRYYLMAEERGSVSSYLHLAEAYEKGIGVEKSRERADYYYQKTFLNLKEEADAGCASAQSTLAFFFEKGLGVEKSLESAFHYYHLSADQLFPEGLDGLATCFRLGLGVQKSTKKAIHYYRLAAEKGGAFSMYQLARMMLTENMYEEEAVRYLKLIVQRGCSAHPFIISSANYHLGKCFENGIGIKKSSQNAIYYYKLAAGQGSCLAQSRLGDAYLNGELGIKKNSQQAIHYYRLAADQGDVYSYKKLGECYKRGGGVEKSEEIVLEYSKNVSDPEVKSGNSTSQFIIGLAREKGVEKPQEFATQHFQRISEKANIETFISLGKEFDNQGRYEEAFASYKKAADQGDSRAQNKVGNYYKSGKGIEKDLFKAAYYYQLAADQNDQPALCNLALCYEEGQGVDKSDEQAFLLFKKSADQGFPRGQFHLARCYIVGIGVKKSLLKAIEYYELAFQQNYRTEEIEKQLTACRSIQKVLEDLRLKAEAGDMAAQLRLGEAYLTGKLGLEKDKRTAMHFYALSAEQGNLDACSKLFYCYHRGNEEIEQSYEKALHYLKILADRGNPLFQHNLGVYFERGYGGLQQSNEQAFAYFKMAAEQGCAPAQYALGNYFKNGTSVEQSDKIAFEYFKMAADNGDSDAQCALGFAYHNGWEVEQSDKQAFKYYKLSADQGNQIAISCVADCYRKGIGVDNSFIKAFDYYKRGEDQDNPRCLFCLAVYFKDGLGEVEKSPAKAFEYYKKSADLGYALAYYFLGKAYLWGDVDIGIEKDELMALHYLTFAADQGVKKAQYLLAECYRHGGNHFKQSWEDALTYYQLAANQGHLGAIHQLFRCYHFGIHVKQSDEKAGDYLKLGADLNDPECQYMLAEYYLEGKGNIPRSFLQALRYFQLAASHKCKSASISLNKIHKILHPHAQFVNLNPYFEDNCLSTLKNVLEGYEKKPLLLSDFSFSLEEAHIICNAMINNTHFTVMCNEEELERLFLAFKLKGYQPEQDVNECLLSYCLGRNSIHGCTFIAFERRHIPLETE